MKSISRFAYVFFLIFIVLVSGCNFTRPQKPTPQDPLAANTTANCQFKYDHVSDKGILQKVLYREAASNQGDAQITAQFSAQKGGSVSITVGAKLSVKVTPPILKAVLEGTVEINSQVVDTSTASVGNTITFTLPPHTYGYGNYGINMQVTSGHLYSINCPEQNIGNATFNIPFSQGAWCTWTSSTPMQTSDKCPELRE